MTAAPDTVGNVMAMSANAELTTALDRRALDRKGGVLIPLENTAYISWANAHDDVKVKHDRAKCETWNRDVHLRNAAQPTPSGL